VALVRLNVTEHGIVYRARAPGQRSHHSSRRSHDLPRRLGKPVVGPRVTGEPLKPDAATRNAERPKGEKRQLASRLPGNSYGRFARCADGKGPRERYLVSRLSYLERPFVNEVPWVFIARLFFRGQGDLSHRNCREIVLMDQRKQACMGSRLSGEACADRMRELQKASRGMTLRTGWISSTSWTLAPVVRLQAAQR
jgi:hypothetical protein